MTDEERSATRRAYLRTAGTVAAVGSLAGCGRTDRGPTTSAPTETTETTPGERTTTDEPTATGEPTETATPSELADRRGYETVVNVATASVDTQDGEAMEAFLEEKSGDDTLFYFPSGRYRLAEWRATDYRNLGIVGDDAVLAAPSDATYWLKWARLDDLLFEGFTIDCRGKGVAPIARVGVGGGTSVVRNVVVRGHRHVPRNGFEIEVTDPDGELTFENVALPDGSTTGDAMFVFPASTGTLTFRNCRIEDWHEGLYSAYHSGPLRILGGYYANNGIEQVRVGGGTAGALVRGATVRVDDPRRPNHKPNMRGIWAEEGASARIENCDIAITDLTGTYSSGGIVVGTQFGEVTIANTDIRIDADTYAVSLRDPIESMDGQTIPSMDRLPKRTRVTARNVRISGDATTGTAVRTARRDDCRFERVCIQHGGSRDGIAVEDASGCAVRNSTIDVGGEAIRTEDANVTTRGLRTSGSCRIETTMN
ncbi:hypothetical protein M0R88_18040 [Halorussus gelatinilyticus]|uniref:Right-handed parallel beta-helix repeat-containing protein n=1 Tax=Halorussus gelatinilyticus TaxID=2937524 RepID=A0A8U0IHD0_9EURY|nr:hypothetical protein [Halorussus gelatinilyticus]UPW00393.1 hypothetical protein M0R88_18040 [Halorussus gelatinilyticus]